MSSAQFGIHAFGSLDTDTQAWPAEILWKHSTSKELQESLAVN